MIYSEPTLRIRRFGEMFFSLYRALRRRNAPKQHYISNTGSSDENALQGRYHFFVNTASCSGFRLSIST